MFRTFILGEATEQTKNLCAGLLEQGFTSTIIENDENAIDRIAEQTPDLVLIAVDSLPAVLSMVELVDSIKRDYQMAVITLLSKETLGSLGPAINIDDFVLEPWDAVEVAARARRVLRRTNHVDDDEIISCGDLVIDLAKCEVFIGGRSVLLTFKEFELLRFLASNRGRVFTRDALLNKVWGYDYFGGDRTVDVHIRRLRSKIEDSTHTFIETVRNIGYKFKDEI
ncbi:DNA-binding response regulator [Chloroflexota bacterium]